MLMVDSKYRNTKARKKRVGAEFIFARFLGGDKLHSWRIALVMNHPYAGRFCHPELSQGSLPTGFFATLRMTPPYPFPLGEGTPPLLVGEGWFGSFPRLIGYTIPLGIGVRVNRLSINGVRSEGMQKHENTKKHEKHEKKEMQEKNQWVTQWPLPLGKLTPPYPSPLGEGTNLPLLRGEGREGWIDQKKELKNKKL